MEKRKIFEVEGERLGSLGLCWTWTTLLLQQKFISLSFSNIFSLFLHLMLFIYLID